MRGQFWLAITLLLLVTTLVEGFYLFKAYRLDDSRAAVLEYDNRHPFSFHFHRAPPLERFFQDVLGDQASAAKDMEVNDNSLSLPMPKEDETKNEVRLTFDLTGHDKGDYSVKVKNNEVILTGKGQDVHKKVISGIWPFNKITKEREIISEGKWNQLQIFPLPADANPMNFKVEKNKNSLAIIFQKNEGSST